MANIGKSAATSPQSRHQQEKSVSASGVYSRAKLPGVGHGQGIVSAGARDRDDDVVDLQPSTDQSRERAENADHEVELEDDDLEDETA